MHEGDRDKKVRVNRASASWAEIAQLVQTYEGYRHINLTDT